MGSVVSETELWKLVVGQGIFCALFVFLLLYVLKEQKVRDKRNDEFQKTRDDKSDAREDRLVGELKQAQVINQQYAVALEKLTSDIGDIKISLYDRRYAERSFMSNNKMS